MDHLLLISLFFLSISQMGMITTARHATLLSPTEAYWHKRLPNTPIPNAIKGRLSLDGATMESVSSSYHVSGKLYHLNVYSMASVEVSEYPDVSLYFMKNDLRPGTAMTLDFAHTVSTSTSPFLPRKVVDTIPFSTDKLPDILNHLAIRADTPEAKAMQGTLYDCDQLAFKGETHHCATSLESMLDFAISELKSSSVTPIITTAQTNSASALKQSYTITPSGVRRMEGTEVVVCHPMSYPYAVYFCHRILKSEPYTVEMVGEDGTKVEGTAICHTDTSNWNPNYLAFQELKVRPGTTVCHILQRSILWVAAKK